MSTFPRAPRFPSLALPLLLLASAAALGEGPLAPGELGVHQAIRDGALTLFPVTLVARSATEVDFILLDEGLASGAVAITEKGGPAEDPEQAPQPQQVQEVEQVEQAQQTIEVQQIAGSGAQVNKLSVRNDSDRPLLLVAGEMIRGARQDRIVAHDTTIPPKTAVDDIDVFCVESGRWASDSGEFRSAKAVSSSEIRATAQLQKSQKEVWDTVSRTNAAVGATSDTGSLSAAYDKPEVKARTLAAQARLEAELARIPGVCGVVVAIGGRIVVADVFTDPDLFRRLQGKLLAGYLLDAVSSPPTDAAPPTEEVTRRYLAAVLAAAWVEDWRGGDLVVERFETTEARGTRSSWMGEEIHINSY